MNTLRRTAKMQKVIRYMEPHNACVAETLRFVPNFRSLIVSWTPNAVISSGTERFVEEYLPKIRENNPQIEYTLNRTPVLCDPYVQAIFMWGRKKSFRTSFKHESQVLAFVEEMAVGGDFRPGLRLKVSTALPRGQEIWNTESRGHDVYKVFSKWKGDAPDPNEVTSTTHPHFIIRRMQRKRSEMDFD